MEQQERESLAITVSPEGIIKIIPFVNSLEFMQEQVGGYIELVNVDGVCDVYLNEEGKLHNLPINPLVSEFLKETLMPGDFIVGPVLLVSDGEDGDGNTLGLRRDQAERIVEHLMRLNSNND